MPVNLHASHEPHQWRGSGVSLADLVEYLAVLGMCVTAAVIVATVLALLIIV